MTPVKTDPFTFTSVCLLLLPVQVGDRASACWVLLSGRAAVMIDGAQVWVYATAGQLFGEKAFVGLSDASTVRGATVTATADTRCLQTQGDVFKRYCQAPLRQQARALGELDRNLTKHPLFRRVPAASRYGLARDFRQCRARQGEILFDEGEAGENIYIVISGRLRLRPAAGGAADRKVGPGGCVGETELLYATSRAVACAATEDTLCWVLDRRSFLEKVGPVLAAQREAALPAMVAAAKPDTPVPLELLEEMVDWGGGVTKLGAGEALPAGTVAYVVRGELVVAAEAVEGGAVHFGPGSLVHSATGESAATDCGCVRVRLRGVNSGAPPTTPPPCGTPRARGPTGPQTRPGSGPAASRPRPRPQGLGPRLLLGPGGATWCSCPPRRLGGCWHRGDG